MRVLYVAPRYHTNQTAIMKGWLSQGDEVCFLAHYAGKLEDYSVIRPDVVGYSVLFRMIDYLYVHVIGRNKEYAANMRLKCGFPPIFRLIRKMRAFRPDVVITRERSVYSVCVTLVCRFFGWPVILYNQSPALEKEKTDRAHRIMQSLTPAWRITPVYRSRRFELTDRIPDRTRYLPFLMEPALSPERKDYFAQNRINLFCIGKYQKRKNHLLMIRAAEKLAEKYPVHLVIAGEVSDSFQEEYFQKVCAYVKEHRLEQIVELYRDLNRTQVNELYKKSDLFVLPSTDEPAAVSHLEAMAFSLPVISGDDNGTADYIENGRNGYIFRDRDEEDLCQKIELIIQDRQNILKMGRESYQMILQKHQFENYRQNICEIISEIKRQK